MTESEIGPHQATPEEMQSDEMRDQGKSSAPNNIESKENLSQSVYEIRKFATDVWNNPLLDRQTIEFRDQARAKFNEFLILKKIQTDKIIAIPYGSILWSTDAESDADFIMIIDGDTNMTNSDIEALNNQGIAITSPIINPEMLINYKKILLKLLITPDKYLIGNTGLAAHLRKTLLNKIMEKYPNVDYDQTVMDVEFEYYYKNWKDLDIQRKESAKEIHRTRQARFETKLDQRSSQTHAPEKYKDAFMRALDGMWLPDIKIFNDCFNQTNGRLQELPNRSNRIN